MKAFFASYNYRAIKPEHRHDNYLEGQLVAIDCERKKEAVRIDLYKKGQKTYYCCLWIRGWIHERELFITGSGKSNSRFGAVYSALDSAGISFDCSLPELGRSFDVRVWDDLKCFVTAIAEAAGAEDQYVHNCIRSS